MTSILIADSWLVADGSALALDLHRERFLRGIAHRSSIESSEAERFWAEAIAQIPRSGRWFPRVEVTTDEGKETLALHLRSAPPTMRQLRLWTSPVDPRTVPAVKGPDIAALGLLRERAARFDADEAVILDADGTIVDGSTTAIVWWVGETLVSPPSTSIRVASVTARTLATLAGALGVETDELPARPDDLDGREIWAVNALHGIRIVTGWTDGPSPAAEPGRLGLWRRRMSALGRPLPETG